MITYRTGNLLDDDADALVNAVNVAGIMGGGIAKAFRDEFPAMYAVYKFDCEVGIVKPGEIVVYQFDGVPDVINFVTKDRPQNLSRLDFIEEGMKDLVETQPMYGWNSVAFPKLGCGLGGLDWSDVKPIMLKYLEDVDWEARIYE